MYFPAMSFWPGMWRRAARARLPFETQVDARALAARAKELLQTRRPPERCFGCGAGIFVRGDRTEVRRQRKRGRTLDFRTRHWLREQLQKEGAEL